MAASAKPVVRKATLKDIPTIVRLWMEFRKSHDSLTLERDRKLRPYLVTKRESTESFRESIGKTLKSRNGLVLLAESGGKTAGFIMVFIKKEEPLYRYRKLGVFDTLFVREEFRNTGVSSALRKEAESWFRKKGIRHVSLAVYQGNPAYGIYKKWGFKDYHLVVRKRL